MTKDKKVNHKKIVSICAVAFSLLSACEQKINQSVNPHTQTALNVFDGVFYES